MLFSMRWQISLQNLAKCRMAQHITHTFGTVTIIVIKLDVAIAMTSNANKESKQMHCSGNRNFPLAGLLACATDRGFSFVKGLVSSA